MHLVQDSPLWRLLVLCPGLLDVSRFGLFWPWIELCPLSLPFATQERLFPTSAVPVLSLCLYFSDLKDVRFSRTGFTGFAFRFEHRK